MSPLNAIWLTTPEGQHALEAARRIMVSAPSLLRASEQLRTLLTPEHAALALTQYELQHQAATKFPESADLLFTRDGLEQSTSATIAAWRARRFGEASNIIDLCCGIGGDAMALAQADPTRALTLVDLDAVHLELAAYNVNQVSPGTQVATVLNDVRHVSLVSFDGACIDPARRTGDRRLGYASEPPLDWARGVADIVPLVGIKTAPGIPHDIIPADWELECIALGHDLKEAVLWSPAMATVRARATVITGSDVNTLVQIPGDRQPTISPQPGQWLLDPNPAVTRSGLVADLARETGACHIDDEIGFLVSDDDPASPFARSWRILSVLPWHERRLKRELQRLEAGPVDIRRRGLPGDVDAISKRLRGKGMRRIFLAMTRVLNEPTAIICDATPRDDVRTS